MSTPFDSQTWNSALQLNDVTGFDAILERHAPRLSIHDLDSLQSEALNVFVHRTALGGPMLQPLLSLQSVLLQKGDLIGRGLASSAKSPPTRATWLQMREDNNRWRRIVTRLLLGRARGVEPWNDIATSLKLVIEDPTQSSLSVDYAPGNDAWYTIKTVLDSHALEEVLLNEGQEKGIHQHAFRYIGELSGVGSNVGEAFDDTQGLGGQIDAWHLDANIEPGSGSAATEPTAAPTAHPQSGVPATKANAIRRTPHMDAPDGPLAPKTEFDVWIYADKQAPRDGERSTAIVFELPDSILEASVETWISCSSHFEIVTSPIDYLKLKRDEERSTNKLTFKLKVKENLAGIEGDTGRVTALFSYQGAPAGKVTRDLRIDRPATPPPPDDGDPTARVTLASTPPPAMIVGPRRRPDLEVHITRHDDGFAWKFNCTVSGPNTIKTMAVWNLPDQVAPGKFVARKLEQFCSSKVSGAQRPDLLRGAGKSFFTAAPANFKTAYWRLVDEGRPPESIAINSEEPSFPWELLVPHRVKADATLQILKPLGVQCIVGRWVHSSSLPAPQDYTLTNSYVIVPKYTNPLKYAAIEGAYVSDLFSGTAISPATYQMMTKELGVRPVSLLHFACHGRTDPDKGQFIILDNKEEMYPDSANGSEEFLTAFKTRPLVFLNACEAGRQEPTLAGPQGFAPVFVELGACAVIAAVWSVEDDVAHEVAQTIYDSIANGDDVPLAAVLQRLRARSYNKDKNGVAKDSFAAYCCYGDPLLIVRK